MKKRKIDHGTHRHKECAGSFNNYRKFHTNCSLKWLDSDFTYSIPKNESHYYMFFNSFATSDECLLGKTFACLTEQAKNRVQ